MPNRPVSRRPRALERVAVRHRTPWWMEVPLVVVSTLVAAAVDQALAGFVGGVTFVMFRRLHTA